MVALSDKIKTALIQSGKVRFVDVTNRKDIAIEYDYQQSGYVDPAQAKAPGKQTGSDLILTGTLSANVQEVGKDKLIYYKATFQLTDLLTSEIIWTDEKKSAKPTKSAALDCNCAGGLGLVGWVSCTSFHPKILIKKGAKP